MPVPATVRAATPMDAEGIARVHVASWRAAYRGLVPDAHLDALDVDRRRERWESELCGSSQSVFATLVAVDDRSSIVGFARSGPTRDDDLAATGCHEVTAIYTSPGVWGTGVGTSLLAAVTDSLPSGVPCVALWVLAENARGRRLYERAGFTADGSSKAEDIGGAMLEEVRYRLPIV